MAEEKKTLNDVLKGLNKQFGHSAFQLAESVEERPRIKFKQERLNKLTGGGIPRGQFTTLWGGSSCGKTSTVYDIIAEAQKQGLVCIYGDLEHSYDPLYATKHGIDTMKLIYAGGFKNAEESMDAIITVCKAGVADLVVIDSVQGLSPKGEQEEKGGKEKSVENDTMALLARKLSQFFRMAAESVSSSNTAVILVGQTRMDLGSFIKLEQLSGGHALLHWSSLTVHFRRGQKADFPTKEIVGEDGKKEKVIVGFNCVVKVTKSKIAGATEGDSVSLPCYYGHGLTDGVAPVETTIVENPVVLPEVTKVEETLKKKRGRSKQGV